MREIFESFSGVKIEQLEFKGETWKEGIDFTKNKDLQFKIENIVTNPDNYIGKGGAGMVFDIDNGNCIKLVKNRHASLNASNYDLGNDIVSEVIIQNALRGLEVDGVFAPAVLGYYEGKETAAFVMERLDAVDMQMVINEKKKLPAKFDLDDFFYRLESYVDEMHEIGIIHKDLNPKNIMIDILTGKPRLIDFGRSEYFRNKPEDFERMADQDYRDLESSYEQMKAYIDKTIKK